MPAPDHAPDHAPGPAPPASMRHARLEVGRIVRAHGIRGDVIVAPVSNRPERFVAGMELYSAPAGGDRLTIESARRHQDRWLVHFSGFDDRTTAEGATGTALYGEPLGALPSDEFWVHEVVGSDVADLAGRRLGTVVAVEANPASELLVLDGGGLVPAVFVREIEPGRVVVDPPAGLFDV